MDDLSTRLEQCRTMLNALRRELASISLDTDNDYALHYYGHVQTKLDAAKENLVTLLINLQPPKQ